MDIRLDNKTALVTGSSTGIGKAIATEMHASGARVIIADINLEIAQETAAGLGEPALAMRLDLADVTSCTEVIADIITQIGQLDILVNNGGICPLREIEAVDQAFFDQIIAVNLRGAYFLSQGAARHMKARQTGWIINISSVGGRTGGKLPVSVYSASKAALFSVTKSFASYLAPYGTANTVAPGPSHKALTDAWVLLIDTDSQGHATLVTTGYNDFGKDNSLYTVLVADRKDASHVLAEYIVQSEWDPDLHVLPASPLLEGAERELQGTAGAPYRLSEPLSKNASHYLVTKMDRRIKGHVNLLEEIQAHNVLGPLLCGVIPQNEAVSYSHHHHLSVYYYDPKAAASKAYAELVGKLLRQIARPKAGGGMKRQKREINTSLLDQLTADMLGGENVDFLRDDSLRAERILLELVCPDPLQPRRVLPGRIYQAFHSDQMTPTQALRELIQSAQLTAPAGTPIFECAGLTGQS